MITGIDISTKDVAITHITRLEDIFIGGHKKIDLSQQKSLIKKLLIVGNKMPTGASTYENMVFIERPVYSRFNSESDLIVGAVASRITQADMVEFIAPNQWKKAIGYPTTYKGQKGLTEKEKVAWFNRHYPQTIGLDPDIIDAFGIALGGAIKYGLIKKVIGVLGECGVFG